MSKKNTQQAQMKVWSLTNFCPTKFHLKWQKTDNNTSFFPFSLICFFQKREVKLQYLKFEQKQLQDCKSSLIISDLLGKGNEKIYVIWFYFHFTELHLMSSEKSKHDELVAVKWIYFWKLTNKIVAENFTQWSDSAQGTRNVLCHPW